MEKDLTPLIDGILTLLGMDADDIPDWKFTAIEKDIRDAFDLMLKDIDGETWLDAAGRLE